MKDNNMTKLVNVIDRNGEHRVARINACGEWTSISNGVTSIERHDPENQCAGNWLGNSPVKDAVTDEIYHADLTR